MVAGAAVVSLTVAAMDVGAVMRDLSPRARSSLLVVLLASEAGLSDDPALYLALTLESARKHAGLA